MSPFCQDERVLWYVLLGFLRVECLVPFFFKEIDYFSEIEKVVSIQWLNVLNRKIMQLLAKAVIWEEEIVFKISLEEI